MSFYTSSLRTSYFEANVFSAKNRVEYRLDEDRLFLSNMRLLGVSNNESSATARYSIGTGVLQFIKTIELLDGSKKLSRLDNVDGYYTFTSVNNANEKGISKQFLDKTSTGYVFGQSGVNAGNNTYAIRSAVNANTLIDQPNATKEGQIDLNNLLPFLKESRILPTSIFKHLKLVITFNSNGLTTWTGANPPVLAVDEMLNTEVADAMVKSYKGFVWDEIENDQFTVQGIAQASLANDEVRVQSTNAQLKGFDNKVVKRCFIQKKADVALADIPYSQFGSAGSAPQNREVFQVRKNGANIYPSNGLNTPAKIQNEVVQIWGQMAKPVITPFNPALQTGLNGDSYLAFDLTGNRTNELQIQYQRSVLKDNAANFENRTSSGLRLNVMGEVEKLLQIDGSGDYRILYA